MLKIKVVKSDAGSWYHDCIGQCFNVDDTLSGNYYTMAGRDGIKYFYEDDVEIIDDKSDSGKVFYIIFDENTSVCYATLQDAITNAKIAFSASHDSIYIMKSIAVIETKVRTEVRELK